MVGSLGSSYASIIHYVWNEEMKNEWKSNWKVFVSLTQFNSHPFLPSFRNERKIREGGKKKFNQINQKAFIEWVCIVNEEKEGFYTYMSTFKKNEVKYYVFLYAIDFLFCSVPWANKYFFEKIPRDFHKFESFFLFVGGNPNV